MVPIGRAVIVVEFHPDLDSDRDALVRLARGTGFRVVAVAQRTAGDLRERDPRFRMLRNVDFFSINGFLGRGAAVRAGLNRVNEPVVAIVNLEDSIDPAAMTTLIEGFSRRNDADVLLGYREGGRHWRSIAFGALAELLFGLGVRDVQGPVKLFRLGPLRSLVHDLQLYDHGVDADLVFNARKRGLRIVEAPVRCRRTTRSWPLFSTAFRAVASLLALRLLTSSLRENPAVRLLGKPIVLPYQRSYSILIFCWRDRCSPRAGGGELYLHEQARCWVAQGHRVTWVSQRFRGSAREETIDGIRIVRRGRSILVFLAAAVWYVLESKQAFDFVIDTMNGIPFFTPLFTSKPKVCLLYHLHSRHFREELPGLVARLAVAVETKLVPYVYRRTHFVTISESSAAEMREHAMTELPIQVIHSGVNASLRPARRHPDPTILFVGRLRRYKGVRKLINAFASLRETIPNLRLVIAGDGDDAAALKAYATGIDGVVFAGRVEEDEKQRLLQEAWVFGMPSALEGWGIVVIEAACCGTPCVAFDVNGLRDCIVEGATGFLARSEGEFASYLRRLLLDDALRSKMSHLCTVWGKNFSWDATAARTLQEIRRAQPWNVVFGEDEGATIDPWDIASQKAQIGYPHFAVPTVVQGT